MRRFVTFEKSQVQQIQLTKIFNVATDGLVVLKEQPFNQLNSSMLNSTRKLKSTVQMIEDSIHELKHSSSALNYDVMF